MRKVLGFVLVVLLLVPSLATAQNGWEIYEDDYVRFEYPAGWFSLTNQDDDAVITNKEDLQPEDANTINPSDLASGEIIITINSGPSDDENDMVESIEFEQIDAFAQGYALGFYTGIVIVADAFSSAFSGEESSEPEIDELEFTNDGQTAMVVIHGTKDYFVAVHIISESLNIVSAVAPPGEIDQHRDTILHIISTMQILQPGETDG